MDALVLFHILRSRLQYEDLGRRDYHDRERRSTGDAGGRTAVGVCLSKFWSCQPLAQLEASCDQLYMSVVFSFAD